MPEKETLEIGDAVALATGTRALELAQDGQRMRVTIAPQLTGTPVDARRVELLAQLVVASNAFVAQLPESELDRLASQLRVIGLGALRDAAVDRWPEAPAAVDLATLPPANAAALSAARARAEATQLELLQRPDMLTGDAFAARVGVTRATINNRRLTRQLLALDLGNKRGVRYPDWQVPLSLDTARRAALAKVLPVLAPLGDWSAQRFFTTPQPRLDGQRPCDALLAGERERVLQAAELWAAGEQGGG